MSNESQIAVVTIPLDEWNEHKSLLKKINERVTELTNKDQKELLTPKEVCNILKISRTTFERYMNNNVFDVIRINKKKYSKVYVKHSHLEKLIREGVV